MTNLQSGPRTTASRLDDLDRRLLSHLQEDARVPTAELARRLDLSGPGLQKRLRKLEDQGVIRGYSTVINREAVGLDLLCFIHVTLAHHRTNSVKQFPEKIKKMPEVLEADLTYTLVLREDENAFAAVAGCGETPERWEVVRAIRIPYGVIERRLAAATGDPAADPADHDLLPPDLRAAYEVGESLSVALLRGDQIMGVQVAGRRNGPRFTARHETGTRRRRRAPG